MKSKFVIVALVGLLMAGGLILISCETDGNCPGDGNCIVSIGQGASGLFIDNSLTRSTCGRSSSYDWGSSSYTGGCKVQNNIDNRGRTHGSHQCDC